MEMRGIAGLLAVLLVAAIALQFLVAREAPVVVQATAYGFKPSAARYDF